MCATFYSRFGGGHEAVSIRSESTLLGKPNGGAKNTQPADW